MSSLAHEGNPKEDEIIITGGSVLSTAQLDIDFLFVQGVQGQPNGPNVPPIADIERTFMASCGEVFFWPGKDDLSPVPPILLTNINSGGSTSRYLGTSVSIQMTPDFHCYGILRTLHPIHASVSGTYVDAGNPYQLHAYYAAFLGLRSGAPRAGICIYVPQLNDLHTIKTFGLVTDWAAGTTGLYYWDGVVGAGGELRDFQTAIEVISYLPDVGDIYFLEMDTAPSWAGFEGIYATIYAADRTTVKRSFAFSVPVPLACLQVI